MKNNFYVYEHWRPDTNTCFYVGKGKEQRAYEKQARNTHWQNIVNKLDKLGLCYKVEFIATNLTEQEAFDLEKERIAFWREAAAALVNMTDGGEGLSNPSEEVRAKIAAARKGKTHSEKTRLKLSEAAKIRKHSEKTRAKIAATQKGKKRKPLSEEHRAKLSASQKGEKALWYGKKLTEETRKKISMSQKKRWANVKTRNGPLNLK